MILVLELLSEFQDIFALKSGPLDRTSLVRHTINVGNNPPIREQPGRIPIHQLEEVEKVIKDMESHGITEPADSPWAAPVVIVRKNDGSYRFCIDYRKLNAVTRKDAYPLPWVEQSLDALAGNSWFSSLDLTPGY